MTPRPLLLLVDDEAELRALVHEYLSLQGFEVLLACDAAQARATLAGLPQPPALVLLDVNMPGENGLQLARWLREQYPRLGVVMLTTVSDTIDRVVGLEMGADDYLPKPFELRELLARVRAVLRRLAPAPEAPAAPGVATAGASVGLAAAGLAASPAAASAPLPFGQCLLDLHQRKLLDAQGQELPLTAAEFDLLALFARHPHRPLSRDQIMEQAHNRGWDVFDRSIDLRIMRLRRKVERNPDKPEVLKTVRNVGYVFVPR